MEKTIYSCHFFCDSYGDINRNCFEKKRFFLILMPDLFVHSFFSAIFYKIYLKWSRYTFRWDFLLMLLWGTLLPDLVTRPILILFPQWINYFFFLHFTIPMFVFCLLIYELFLYRFENGRKYCGFLFLGSLSHNFLDFFQYHLSSIQFAFFPIYNRDISFGVIEPDDTIYISIILFLILFISLPFIFLKRRRK